MMQYLKKMIKLIDIFEFKTLNCYFTNLRNKIV